MSEARRDDRADWPTTAEEINRAMARGVLDALREHKAKGNSVVVWDREHDGIVHVPPEEIVVPESNGVTREVTEARTTS